MSAKKSEGIFRDVKVLEGGFRSKKLEPSQSIFGFNISQTGGDKPKEMFKKPERRVVFTERDLEKKETEEIEFISVDE
jgi:hypothetical protein